MTSSGEHLIGTVKKTAMCLRSNDKKVRKQTLIDLEKLLSNPQHILSNEDLSCIFVETQTYVLNSLRDDAETVREQGIKFMWFLVIDKLPLNDFYLTYVSPVLVERIGSVELIEESEEIRLELVKFLQAIILKYANTEQLKPFLGDCVMILCERVKDKHPSIKELSCRCVVDLAQALPQDFHMQAENLVKPIVTCFWHQRFKVRVAAIRAIGEVIMHETYKGLDEVVGPMAAKLFDDIPLVRRTIAQVAARWLREYRDRYSFFHKILPLLLTGLNDEVEETRLEAHELWQQVGLQYMKENEKDLKDQMDFLVEPPKYYPADLKRPNLGCRVLVQRNVSKLARALSSELSGWQEDVRVRCSQLLCSLALHAEDGLTQNFQELLPAMYFVARDEDPRVKINIVRASELMGYFIPATTWFKFVLPVIEGNPHFGHLAVLYGFLKGTPEEYITERLQEVTEILSETVLCCTRKTRTQNELMKCVDIISEKYTEKSAPEVGFHLFKILIALISLRDQNNTDMSTQLLDPLYKMLGFPTCDHLWSAYTPHILTSISKDPKSWTLVTPQRCIFETVLTECGPAFGENLSSIANILTEALDQYADPESRLRTFYALLTAFENKSVIFKNAPNLTEFFKKLISSVFVPTLIWRPGLTAEALRTMAASCLLRALNPMDGSVDLFTDGAMLRQLCDTLVPLLLSLVVDASYRSRDLGMECLAILKKHCSKQNVWTSDELIRIYPEILKRLDDPIEQVRQGALKVLPEIFSDAPDAFKEPHFKAHHELIIDTLLTHFDDDDKIVRDLVFDVLKVVANINPEEVRVKVERHKPLLCNQEGCDDVAEYLKQLKLS